MAQEEAGRIKTLISLSSCFPILGIVTYWPSQTKAAPEKDSIGTDHKD